MKLQVQPNRYTCIPTAFAIYLDIPVQKILDGLGHDGSLLVNGEPRGFHPQELVLYAYKHNHYFMQLQLELILEDNDGRRSCIDLKEDVTRIIKYNSGVILGKTNSGKNHAVAWNMTLIFDPNGSIYGLESFIPEYFFFEGYL